MAEFNYKKWITENKYGIQPTMDDFGGMVNEAMAPCDNYSGQNLGCETFKECGGGTNKAYHFMSANFTNTYFHGTFCQDPTSGQPPAIGDVVKIQEGTSNILLLEYTGVNVGTTTENLGSESSWNMIENLGPTTPTPGTGCTAPLGWECNTPGQPCTNTCIQGTAGCEATAAACQSNCVYTSCQNCCCKELGGGVSEQRGGRDMGDRGRRPSDDTPRTQDPTLIDPSISYDPITVGGCKTGTDFAPDPSTLDPQTGQCDCGPTNPYGGATILSTPNTGQC